MHRRQRRRYGFQHEFPVVPERYRVVGGAQRRAAGMRYETLRGVHGRGQVSGLYQEQRRPMTKRSMISRD